MKLLRLRSLRLTRGKWVGLIITICVLVVLHHVIVYEQKVAAQEEDFADLDEQTLHMAWLRSLKPLEDFPTSGKNLLPKIIHQTWKTTDVPDYLARWIQSWVNNQPGWRYMFWTDNSARELIADKFPEYLLMFDQYSEGIRRADALRYFVLYEYGGVYADLDMESLKSLEPMTFKYHCFLGQEPYEHPMLDSNAEHLAINAVMGCRAKHPFMKFVIENLPSFSHMWNVLDSTGPHFLTLLYHAYLKSVKTSTHRDGVYLTPPDYFFPTLDPVKFPDFKRKCKRGFKSLSRLQQKACVSLKANGLKREPLPYSFALHHWMKTYTSFSAKNEGEKTIKIKDVVPKSEIYKQVETG